MIFGISGTKRTVRNRGVRKERLDRMYVTSAENRSCRTPVTYHLTRRACYWIRQRLVNMVNRVFDWRSKVLSGILLNKGCS